ncbi:Replication factor C subunit 1 [Blattella germanica]|nr:Replication factor C subunit 1 [Blattella germanica]
MSRDIRSFFLPSGGNKKKDGSSKEGKVNSASKPRKRQIIILDSDSDEDPLPPQVKKHKSSTDSKASDVKVEKTTKNKKESEAVLKPVSAADVFGDSRVKRSAPKVIEDNKKLKNDTKLKLEDKHGDSDFEATLRQLDERGKPQKKENKCELEDDYSDSEFEAVLKQLDEREILQDKEKKISPVKELQNKKQAEKTPTPDKGRKEEKRKQKSPIKDTLKSPSPKKDFKDKLSSFSNKLVNGKGEHKEKKRSDSDLSSDSRKSVSETKESANDKSVLDTSRRDSSANRKESTDDSFSDDAFEKKRLHAIQYQKYLHREGPKNPGGKEIPEGKPNCLSGKVFVLTGVLDTIDRDQATSIIKQYGGKVTSSLSRNTSYIVVGDEPGPSKIEKATKLGTKQLTEDGLLDLLRNSHSSPDKKGGTSKKANKKESTKEESKKESTKEESKKESNVKNKHKDEVKTSKEEVKVPKEEIKTSNKEIKTPNKEVKTPKDEMKMNKPPHPLMKTASCNISLFFASEKTKKTTILPTTSQSKNIDVSATNRDENISKNASLWVDKYKPTSVKQIIGQQGDRSNVKKLLKWLGNWHSNHSGKKKLVRPSPWAKDDFGSFFKAALLSGPPGVGKTTTAHLVCKELGFDVVEFNASDTRSKKLLNEEVSELLSTKSLSGYFEGASGAKPTEKHVLLMDEVDGMAGNEDRGGVQELIQLIKHSRIPIICMCNDRHHPKIRSLTNYCFDLQFSKPRVEQIRGAMLSICFKEGIKIAPEALNDIINGSNHDIRQVLHHLSMWSINDKQLSTEQIKEESEKAKKHIKLGPWDTVKKVFSADAHKTMSISDKMDLFFNDYSLGPLFVQENYLGVQPHKAKGNRNNQLERIAQTAEILSSGDIVEKAIRSKNSWSLLPMQAMYSSVIPGSIMEGHLTTQINFPAWFGKNSKSNKFSRLTQELYMHMSLSISGSRRSLSLDYLQNIRDALVNPLIKEGADGVPQTLGFMQNYYLMREDLDSVMELTQWPQQKDPMSLVESKVKAALTRAYNKEGIMTPYSIIQVKKGSGKSSQDSDMQFDDEDNGEEVQDNEEEEDITKDAMIKAKKRPAPSKDSGAGGSGAKKARGAGNSSRGGGAGKGNAKKESKGKRK